MRIPFKARLICRLGAFALGISIAGTCCGQSVPTYHGGADRSGNFVVPSLTWERARNIHLEPGFHPRFSGHVYAQPLYWRPPGSAGGVLIVATEGGTGYSVDVSW